MSVRCPPRDRGGRCGSIGGVDNAVALTRSATIGTLIRALRALHKASADLGYVDFPDDRGHARAVHLDIANRSPIGMLGRSYSRWRSSYAVVAGVSPGRPRRDEAMVCTVVEHRSAAAGGRRRRFGGDPWPSR